MHGPAVRVTRRQFVLLLASARAARASALLMPTPERSTAPAASTPEPVPAPPAVAPSVPAPAAVSAGIDVLVQTQAGAIRGRHLGLITNQSGRDHDGRSTIDVLRALPDVHLVALFSPEHGIRGEAAAGEDVDSGIDPQTGLPVFSLYGVTTRPTPQMLSGIDTLVFDIQDVGARVYTYTSTLREVLRAGAEYSLPVVVLDRPNPITGQAVQGNVLDPRFASFVGPAPLAMRYGLTIGEVGLLFNDELAIGAELSVVPMSGWQRDAWYDQTDLTWVNPSPNIRSLAAATVYPGSVLVEGTNLSEGRGTERPFEWIGAPWMDAPRWSDLLNTAAMPGVRAHPISFTPTRGKFAGEVCRGVQLEVVDRTQLDPMALGVAVLATARAVAGSQFQIDAATFDRLAGTDRLRMDLLRGASLADIVDGWQPDLARFQARRAQYLIYPDPPAAVG